MMRAEQPTRRDLERAMDAVAHLAKRVTVVDPKHAEFHQELNHLLDEWEAQKFLARGLTLVQPTW